MLKVECDEKKNTCSIECNGDIIELASDVAKIINNLYFAIMRNSKTEAEMMRKMIKAIINDKYSPIWQPHEGTTVFIPLPDNGKPATGSADEN